MPGGSVGLRGGGCALMVGWTPNLPQSPICQADASLGVRVLLRELPSVSLRLWAGCNFVRRASPSCWGSPIKGLRRWSNATAAPLELFLSSSRSGRLVAAESAPRIAAVGSNYAPEARDLRTVCGAQRSRRVPSDSRILAKGPPGHHPLNSRAGDCCKTKRGAFSRSVVPGPCG